MKNVVTQKSKVQTSDSQIPLRKFVTCGVLSLFLLVSHASNAQEACITVDIYGGFEASGGGAPYSDLVGTFNASSVSFATDNGFDWHPFGLFEFGADIRGCLNVAADGEYTFTLDSDDGSLLFIDGNLVVDNGETHPPQTGSGSATLTAGMHTFEVQFFECCGGPSGVDLILPEGVSYTCCSKPSIDLTDLAVICGDDPCVQTGSFDIINVSDEPRTVTVESITGTIVFIGQRGVKTECEATIIQTVPAFPFNIGPGQTQTVMYTLTCTECPPEASAAHEIKNFVDVRLVDRDKDFHASGSCFPFGEEAD